GCREASETTEAHAGVPEGAADHGHHHFEMAARGELRDDATVGRVDVVLRGDHIGEHLAPAIEDGGRRFVAGGLDAEDDHGAAPVTARAATRAPAAYRGPP